MLRFENLSFENLDAATKLVHSVFPEDAKEDRKPGDAYRASLEPEKYSDFYNGTINCKLFDSFKDLLEQIKSPPKLIGSSNGSLVLNEWDVIINSIK